MQSKEPRKILWVGVKHESFLNSWNKKRVTNHPDSWDQNLRNWKVQGLSEIWFSKLNQWNDLWIENICYNRLKSKLCHLDQIWSKINQHIKIWYFWDAPIIVLEINQKYFGNQTKGQYNLLLTKKTQKYKHRQTKLGSNISHNK